MHLLTGFPALLIGFTRERFFDHIRPLLSLWVSPLTSILLSGFHSWFRIFVDFMQEYEIEGYWLNAWVQKSLHTFQGSDL